MDLDIFLSVWLMWLAVCGWLGRIAYLLHRILKVLEGIDKRRS